MPMNAEQLVELSLEMAKRSSLTSQQQLYERLEAHADGQLQGETFFPKYHGESDDRYKERPKESLPIGAAILDVLTGSMIGEGVEVTIGEKGSPEDERYQELVRHNGLDREYPMLQAWDAGTFGWLAEKVLPWADPEERQLEFESVPPTNFETAMDTGGMGRSVKRIGGVIFLTVYDRDAGRILPRNTKVMGEKSKHVRREVISDEIWKVYLDLDLAQADPITGEAWAPSEDGTNPYGALPVTFLWNQHVSRELAGKSDLDPAYKLAEGLNRLWSDMIYNLQRYFPTLTFPGGGLANVLKMGIGLGLEHEEDAAAPSYIIPDLNIETFMAPMRSALNLCFSFGHTPASALGLGTLFGLSSQPESGYAKSFEFKRMGTHVAMKRANYESFLRRRWKTIAHVLNAPAPYGEAGTFDVDAPVSVTWRSEIIERSAEEQTEEIITLLKERLISHLEAIIRHRGLTDDEEGRKAAQNILDEIGQGAQDVLGKTPLDQILEQELGALPAGGEEGA